MKTKVITIIMITLFLASMLSVGFMTPVSANPDGLILESGHGGTAKWTTETAYSGDYSVKLSIRNKATEDAYAEVCILVPATISLGELDLDDTYFWCKSTVGAWTPYFIFELEDGDRVNTDAFSSTGYTDWAKYIASDSPEFQWPDGSWHSWDDTVDYFGADTLVTRVYVELSGLQNPGELDWGPFTSYVDYVVINDVPYDLEKPIAEEPITLLRELKTEIGELDGADFKNPRAAKGQGKALLNKVDAVIRQVEAGAYEGAINKLEHDIRPKLDYTNKRSWVVAHLSDILGKIDSIIDILEG